MARASRTRDHVTIRDWIEKRGGVPTIVKGKGAGGPLRVDFEEGDESAGTNWETFFRVFDENELVFLHSEEKGNRFFKFVASSDRQESESSLQTFEVMPADEGWEILSEGQCEGECTYRTKKEAVSRARELARSHQPSEMVIHKSDGEVETTSHYGTRRSRRPE